MRKLIFCLCLGLCLSLAACGEVEEPVEQVAETVDTMREQIDYAADMQGDIPIEAEGYDNELITSVEGE